MKMRTKKCGVYAALAAVLLITAMLVITCTDPITSGGSTTTQEVERETFTPPPGKAYLRVSLPSEAGRTILPGLETVSYYTVQILDQSGDTPADDYDETDSESYKDSGTDEEFGNFAAPTYKETWIVEADKTYQVHIFAYNSSDIIIASGSNTVTVDDEGNGSVSIAIKEIIDGATTKGTFTYNITLPSAPLSSATLALTTYPGNTAVSVTQPNLNTTNSGTMQLDSGFYWVKVTFEKARHTSATYTQILHVYGNQTSSWTSGTLNPLRKNAYDVMYSQNDYIVSPATEPQIDTDDNGGAGWPHAQIITMHSTYGNPSNRLGWHVEGWYKEAGTTNKWVFASELIYKDTTLFAKWEENPEGLVITIVPYTHVVDGQFHFGLGGTTSTASYPHGSSSLGSLSITVANTNGLPDDDEVIYFDAAKGWYYNDNLVVFGYTLTATDIATYNAADLPGTSDPPEGADKIDFTQYGDHVFTFVGTKGVGLEAKDYSGTFTITIY